MKKKTKTIKAWAALTYMNELIGWLGGDGTRLPVWEDNALGITEAHEFLGYNKFHKPKLVPVTITYEVPKKPKK